jgi:phosphoesterase RecJ-like protein
MAAFQSLSHDLDVADALSMRSKSEKVNVCAICEKFGGGGHVLAAGARVLGSLAEVEKNILEEVCDVVGRSS